MRENIRVSIASDQEHDKVVAEIFLDDKFVALMSHDSGTPIVEIPGAGLDENFVTRIIGLEDLQYALNLAHQRLVE